MLNFIRKAAEDPRTKSEKLKDRYEEERKKFLRLIEEDDAGTTVARAMLDLMKDQRNAG